MIIVNNYSLKQIFNRVRNGKKIVFFGAGQRLRKVLELYGEFLQADDIDFIVDTNYINMPEGINFRGRNIKICSAERIRNYNFDRNILIITVKDSREIVLQLQTLWGNNGECWLLPEKIPRDYLDEILLKRYSSSKLNNLIAVAGQNDTCENVNALVNYIAKKNYFGQYTIVWFCDEPEKFTDKKNEIYIHREVSGKRISFRDRKNFYKYLCTAKVLVCENKLLTKNNPKQILLYLNHGSPSIKNPKGFIDLPKEIDYCLAPSLFAADQIAYLTGLDRGKVTICGAPRHDVLFMLNDRDKVKRIIKFEDGFRYILWVPTFREHKNFNRCDSRKHSKFGIPILSDEREFVALTNSLEKNHCKLIIKPHPHQDLNYLNVLCGEDIIIVRQNELEENNVSSTELMKECAAMITDYSSISFDYMLLNRPIGYTVDDLADYKLGILDNGETDLRPGMKINNLGDLLEFISDVGAGLDRFKEERQKINYLSHKYMDCHNCERVCKLLHLE